MLTIRLTEDEEKPTKPVEGDDVEPIAEQETTKAKLSNLFGGMNVGSASTKLFGYAKDAGKKLGEVKNAVIENTMLGELNKEQCEFEKQLDEERNSTKLQLPWDGLPDQSLAKKQILSLSLDTRNFLRDSPKNSEYTDAQQQAMAAVLVDEDPNLAKVRFQLVPKQVKEEKFWRNYFYRVGLIRQSILANAGQSPTSAVLEPTTSGQVLLAFATNGAKETTADVNETSKATQEDVDVDDDEAKKSTTDDGNAVKTDDDVVQTTEPQAGDAKTSTLMDDEWEKEILSDLNEFVMVAERPTDQDDDAWEQEIQQLLDSAD